MLDYYIIYMHISYYAILYVVDIICIYIYRYIYISIHMGTYYILYLQVYIYNTPDTMTHV